MENKPISIMPDVITAASDAAQNNIPETVKQTDGVLSTVVGFFNDVVLYPVKKANITFRYKLESFEEDLKDKIKDIPEENIQAPSVMLAGPTLEALRYTYDEKALREMFENLLACAMDNRNNGQIHPAFVDDIKKMSPLDAEVLDKIIDLGRLKCAEITFQIVNSEKVYVNAMPNHFCVELCDLADPFLVSLSIVNLDRMGLIKITESGISGGEYESMKENSYVKDREKLFRTFENEFDIKINKHAIIVTDYGRQFAKICLNKNI